MCVLFAFPILTCILRSYFLLAFFNYETPKWYLIQGMRQKSYEVLSHYCKEECVAA